MTLSLSLNVSAVNYALEISQAIVWAIGFHGDLMLESVNSSPRDDEGPYQILTLEFKALGPQGPRIYVYFDTGVEPSYGYGTGALTCVTLCHAPTGNLIGRWESGSGKVTIRRLVDAWNVRQTPNANAFRNGSDVIETIARSWKQLELEL